MAVKPIFRSDLRRPSFGRGMARTLDIFGRFATSKARDFSAESDEQALADDWKAVGKDLAHAMETVRKP
jgi:hypothetical protein